MSKTDSTVKKETLYLLSGVLFFTALLQLVLLLLGSAGLLGVRYTWVTPAASIWTDVIMVLDFYLMGRKLQKIVESGDSANATMQMKASSSGRFFLKLILLGLGIWLVYWVFTAHSLSDLVALLLPVFFPRLTLLIRSLVLKKRGAADPNETKGNDT